MTAEQWFEKYGESHRHPTNKLIHSIAVPLIYISIIGLLWELPVPGFLPQYPLLNWSTMVLSAALVFYFYLSPSLGGGMLLFSLLAVAVVAWFDSVDFAPTWISSLALFAVLWVFQFVGHAIEGKKPAFFDDVIFLLIGPLWLLGFIYRALKIKY